MDIHDPYGSLTAAMVALTTHEQLTRGSGRTTTMILAAVDTGGTIVCSSREHRFIQQLVRKEMNPRRQVDVVVADPRSVDDVYRRVRHGPIYFDHAWLADFTEEHLMRQHRELAKVYRQFPSPQHYRSGGMTDYARNQYQINPIGDPWPPFPDMKIKI